MVGVQPIFLQDYVTAKKQTKKKHSVTHIKLWVALTTNAKMENKEIMRQDEEKEKTSFQQSKSIAA